MRVYIRHLRQLGYCSRGARKWFARRGYDWSHFVRHGIAADDLRATGDAMAMRAADKAEQDGQ